MRHPALRPVPAVCQKNQLFRIHLSVLSPPRRMIQRAYLRFSEPVESPNHNHRKPT